MHNRFLIAMFLFAAPLLGQQPRLQLNLPGLAQRASQVTDVSLDGAALKMGLAFISAGKGQNDPDYKMLSRLQGIYVKSYEFHRAGEVSPSELDPIRRQLQAGGWQRLVLVRSRSHGKPEETDEVYLLTGSGGVIQGMAVLALEPRELNVVNIVGPIDPAELASLGGHFGIPDLQMAAKAGRH